MRLKLILQEFYQVLVPLLLSQLQSCLPFVILVVQWHLLRKKKQENVYVA